MNTLNIPADWLNRLKRLKRVTDELDELAYGFDPKGNHPLAVKLGAARMQIDIAAHDIARAIEIQLNSK